MSLNWIFIIFENIQNDIALHKSFNFIFFINNGSPKDIRGLL